MKDYVSNLIDTNNIWKDKLGNWNRNCPQCNSVITHVGKYSFYQVIKSYKLQKECKSCSHAGSNNGRYGKLVGSETRQKISLSLLGEKHPLFGKHLSKCTKDKISIALCGRHFTETHRRNISEASKGKKITWVDKILLGQEKSRYKRKEYKFPNGSVKLLQGYEPWTMDYLLSQHVDQNDIKTTSPERPIICYEWDSNPKKYYPDCYLSSSKMIVETKSTWTWKQKMEQTQAKITASLDDGHSVRLIIWGHNRTLVSDITYTLNKSA